MTSKLFISSWQKICKSRASQQKQKLNASFSGSLLQTCTVSYLFFSIKHKTDKICFGIFATNKGHKPFKKQIIETIKVLKITVTRKK
jgi:hypothetical protein